VVSDSFQDALAEMVTEVGGRLRIRPPGGGAPSEQPAAVMVMAGGREGEALARLPSLDGAPWYFIGAAADHRLAAAAVRAGAADYLVLPEDIDSLVGLDSDPEVMRYVTYGVPTPREPSTRPTRPGPPSSATIDGT